MRICFVCNEYPPEVHGGIGTFTKDLAEGIASAGHEVSVLGVYQGIASRTTQNHNGVHILREKGSTIKYPVLQFLHNLVKLNILTWRFVRSHRIDLVEAPEYLGYFPLGKWFTRIPLVIRLHGAAIFFDKELNRKGNRLLHLCEKMTMGKADRLVAVSDYCGRKTLLYSNLRNREYTVIHNAVDTAKLVNKRKDYKQRLIVFANTVNPKKGVIELVKAFNILGETYPDAQLVIIGKAGYTLPNGQNIKDYLYSLAKPAVIERLRITGWLSSREEVLDYLTNAHVCVYPSHMEGFGIAPAEAMALSKATVFTNLGPGPEVIDDNINGLLCDPFSPEDIARKIRMVFDDDSLRSILAANARKKVLDKFEKSKWVHQNLTYYESIIKPG